MKSLPCLTCRIYLCLVSALSQISARLKMSAVPWPYCSTSWKSHPVDCIDLRCRDSYELWCWRRTLWTPWTARKTNQWVLTPVKPKLSLKAKNTNRGYLWSHYEKSLEKATMLGEVDGIRKRGKTQQETNGQKCISKDV